MNNLSSLYLALRFCTSKVALDVLEVVSNSKITTLVLYNDCLSSEADPKFLTSICDLINPSSSTIKNLVLDLRLSQNDLKALSEVVLGQTSLNQLTMCVGLFYEESLALLQDNTCLTHVQFKGNIQNPFLAFTKVLRNNRTIQVLRWYVGSISSTIDTTQVETLKEALSVNTALKEFIVVIGKYSPHLDWSSLSLDSRVTLSHIE